MWFLFLIIIVCTVLASLKNSRPLELYSEPKNLVIITSVIHTTSLPLSYSSTRSVMSSDERLAETLNTIRSIKNKIPNPYIVLIEGSNISKNEEQKLYEEGCDMIYNVSDKLNDVVNGKHKSVAEVSMIMDFLDNYSLEAFETLSKISGRYYLTDNFSWRDPTKALYQCERENRCNTRYYRIPREYFPIYKDTLKQALNDDNFLTGRVDIEGYNIFRAFPRATKIMMGHDVLGVKGHIAPTGQVVEDFYSYPN